MLRKNTPAHSASAEEWIRVRCSCSSVFKLPTYTNQRRDARGAKTHKHRMLATFTVEQQQQIPSVFGFIITLT